MENRKIVNFESEKITDVGKDVAIEIKEAYDNLSDIADVLEFLEIDGKLAESIKKINNPVLRKMSKIVGVADFIYNIHNSLNDKGNYVFDDALNNPPSELEKTVDDIMTYVQMVTGNVSGVVLDAVLESTALAVDLVMSKKPNSWEEIKQAFGYEDEVVEIVFGAGVKNQYRATRYEGQTEESYDDFHTQVKKWKSELDGADDEQIKKVLREKIVEKKN